MSCSVSAVEPSHRCNPAIVQVIAAASHGCRPWHAVCVGLPDGYPRVDSTWESRHAYTISQSPGIDKLSGRGRRLRSRKNRKPFSEARAMRPIESGKVVVRTVISIGLLTGIAGISHAQNGGETPQPGAVYVSTNQLANNEIVAYSRAADGTLTPLQTIDTGGLGTQGPTESQDAMVLSNDNSLLFTVNVGSDDISVFQVDPGTFELTFVQRIASGGDRPVSLDVREDLLYVVNSGLRPGISGFTIGENGMLTPIEGSIQPLSFGDDSPFGDVTLPCTNIFPALEAGVICNATQPAEIEFSPDGRFLVVSERLTNQFSIYTLDENGVA